MIDHVDSEDKLNNESLLSLGQRGGWLINESGIYSLVLGSKLQGARKFKRWIGQIFPCFFPLAGYFPFFCFPSDSANPTYFQGFAVLASMAFH
ncbi:BRO-N domain-containing protein [Acutalibacter caecimuris]|uniref:BRO-N domain-containing protein n=1 Tax=Acutalibacter caecimuris TaxID=3093657 RepID=UPI002AC8F5F0|nr:BRO family protein [Acutalibacter sp. M00118]